MHFELWLANAAFACLRQFCEKRRNNNYKVAKAENQLKILYGFWLRFNFISSLFEIRWLVCWLCLLTRIHCCKIISDFIATCDTRWPPCSAHSLFLPTPAWRLTRTRCRMDPQMIPSPRHTMLKPPQVLWMVLVPLLCSDKETPLLSLCLRLQL